MAEIKISELSIGDWVRYRDREWIVCSLYQFTEEVGLWRKDSQLCEYVADIEPIPLTSEILEKNGFRKNGEYNEWNIGTWETPYLLGVSLERPAITIKWNGSSIFIDQARSVHQLQHALRLAGVEKEIEV